MAWTLLKATPHQVSYVVTSAAIGDVQNRSLVQIAADCVPGPLKKYLEQNTGADIDSTFGVTQDPKTRVTVRPRNQAFQLSVRTNLGSVDAFSINVGPAEGIVRIEYIHSIRR